MARAHDQNLVVADVHDIARDQNLVVVDVGDVRHDPRLAVDEARHIASDAQPVEGIGPSDPLGGAGDKRAFGLPWIAHAEM